MKGSILCDSFAPGQLKVQFKDMFRGALALGLLVVFVEAKTLPNGPQENGSETVGGKIVVSYAADPGQFSIIVSIRLFGRKATAAALLMELKCYVATIVAEWVIERMSVNS